MYMSIWILLLLQYATYLLHTYVDNGVNWYELVKSGDIDVTENKACVWWKGSCIMSCWNRWNSQVRSAHFGRCMVLIKTRREFNWGRIHEFNESLSKCGARNFWWYFNVYIQRHIVDNNIRTNIRLIFWYKSSNQSNDLLIFSKIYDKWRLETMQHEYYSKILQRRFHLDDTVLRPLAPSVSNVHYDPLFIIFVTTQSTA